MQSNDYLRHQMLYQFNLMVYWALIAPIFLFFYEFYDDISWIIITLVWNIISVLKFHFSSYDSFVHVLCFNTYMRIIVSKMSSHLSLNTWNWQWLWLVWYKYILIIFFEWVKTWSYMGRYVSFYSVQMLMSVDTHCISWWWEWKLFEL